MNKGMETVKDLATCNDQPFAKNPVWKFAIWSRITLLVTQISLNLVVKDYDSSTQVVNKGNSVTKLNQIDSWIITGLDGFQKWDAAYFLHISWFGYEYEQMLPFFPLFPWTTKLIKALFFTLSQGFLSLHACYLLAGFFITTILFIFNAQMIFMLSLKVGFEPRIAVISVVLYCINPASVFMSALYSEVLFLALQLLGLYFLSSNYVPIHHFIMSAVCFGLSGSARSNGILGIGFLAHHTLKELITILFQCANKQERTFIPRTVSEILAYLNVCIKTVFTLVSLLPFLYVQYYGYNIFCTSSLITKKALHKNHWCYNTVPFSYSYVQKEYWNLGFMTYFEWKQLPNFLLASPVCIITFGTLYCYVCKGKNSRTFFTLGLLSTTQNVRVKSKQTGHDFLNNPHMTPYLLHSSFLALFGIFNIHVQVLTRLLFSASPLLYWFCASIIYRNFKDQGKETNAIYVKMLLFYFLSYYFFGILLHCNFYPWT